MTELEAKQLTPDTLTVTVNKLRQQGKKIVTTNGCFDLLHWGHIKYLAEARAQGDVLIVGVNSDSSVKAIKGESRPIFPQNIRLLQLAALAAVDYVYLFDQPTPVEFLEKVRPDVHVKGADYQGKPLPESDTVKKHGGEIRFVPYVPGYSTTELIARLRRSP